MVLDPDNVAVSNAANVQAAIRDTQQSLLLHFRMLQILSCRTHFPRRFLYQYSANESLVCTSALLRAQTKNLAPPKCIEIFVRPIAVFWPVVLRRQDNGELSQLLHELRLWRTVRSMVLAFHATRQRHYLKISECPRISSLRGQLSTEPRFFAPHRRGGKS